MTEQTFETLAFMFSMDEDEVEDRGDETIVAAYLEFVGECSGIFVVAVTTDMMIPLASNMLGISDVDPTESEQRDALKELANVICGNVLPALAGERAVFNMNPPHLIYGRFVHDNDPVASTKLILDEGVAEVELFLTDNPPEEWPGGRDNEADSDAPETLQE